jgi:NAD(P)-dependent dehydrogenase (short-subunit alcohol dehydrogenase family)
MKLQGHRALITGAGQGIGRACAEVFASRGSDLVLVDKNAETLEEVVKAAGRSGGEVTPVVLDLTDLEAIPEELERVQAGGLVDILVNNAGFDRPGTLSKTDRQDFESVLAIHLTVPLLLMRCLLPAMRSSGWGRIINVSSIYGLIGAKGEVAYSTVKAGIIGLTKSVAKEAGRDGVTVNAVLPGLTRTPTIENFMAPRYKEAIVKDTPLGRIAESDEIARVIAFLASDDASYLTAAAIPVSGGWGI